MRSKIQPLVATLLSLLLLAACKSESAPPATRLVEVEIPVTAEVEVTRVVLQEKEVEATRVVQVEVPVSPTPTPIPAGGFLMTARGEDAVVLNPILASDESSRFVISLLYGSMLRPDPFSGEMGCHLCTRWELNGRTYTFTLRDDIFWSDGEPVTTDDFVYTYAALFWGAANESLNSARLDAVERIESIAQVDERTVAVTMNVDDCEALRDLNLPWLPQHRFAPRWAPYGEPLTRSGPFGDADDPHFSGIGNDEMNRAPAVSNGPFLFDEWVPEDHITLVRNPNYFRSAPYLDGLVVRILPEETKRVQMLRGGELDLVERIAPRYLTEIELMGDLSVYKVLDDSYVYLAFQLGDPNDPQARWLEDEDSGESVLNESHGEHRILSDPAVRQAISLGIDRYAIINRAAVGQGVPLAANMLPSLTWAHQDALEPRSYDPAKAAVILEEAGWLLNEETGVREKEGEPLLLNLNTNLSSQPRIQVAELIQEQLGRIGFDISYEAMEWGAFVGLLLGQQFDLAVISWTNLGNNPDDSLFFGSQNDLPGRGFNFISYFNPFLDQLWEDAKRLPGCHPADRGVLYRQIQTTLYDELPYDWLYVPLVLTGANRRLVGIQPGPWGTWYNVESWYLARDQDH